MSDGQLSIQRAFTKKKIIEDRLSEMSREMLLVGVQSEGGELDGRLSKAKERLQKYTDLEGQLRHIRREISKANATNTVTVLGKTMTVSEALAERETIDSKKMFLARLKQQYNNSVREVNQLNDKQRSELAKAGVSKEQQEKVPMAAKLYDPCDLQKVISELESHVDHFQADLRDAITESNNRLFIPWPSHFEQF